MKLLVTGGLGFIGSNFIEYWLANHDDEIVYLDLQTYASNNIALNSVKEDSRYSFVKGDIADERLVSSLVRDADCVVNFAAETHVDNSIANSRAFIHSNIVGVHSLLEAIRKHGKRLHHISTDEVFGSLPVDSRLKFNENTRYDPRNPYSATKASSDHLIRAYHNTYGIPVTISNCSNNFGNYQHPEKFIPKSILLLLSGKKVPIYGEGNQVRDWIYVLDHCSAIDAILQKGKIGETYLISSDNELKNVEVLLIIADKLGIPAGDIVDHVPDRPGHDVHYAIDSSKITRELGWRSKFAFSKALDLTIDHYASNKDYYYGLMGM